MGPSSLEDSQIGPLRMDIICPGDHLPSDLSEWSLKGVEHSFPAELLLNAMKEICRKLREQSNELLPTAGSQDPMGTVLVGIMILDVCTLGLAGLVLGPFYVLGCIFSAVRPTNPSFLSALSSFAARRSLVLISTRK